MKAVIQTSKQCFPLTETTAFVSEDLLPRHLDELAEHNNHAPYPNDDELAAEQPARQHLLLIRSKVVLQDS